MGKVLAIANQKGGVGKTTTCINLAASLVATRRHVLVIDLDPQGNATTGSGIDKHELDTSVLDVLTGQANLVEAICFSEEGGYQLLPSNRDLTAAEVVLLELENREKRLLNALQPVRGNYDYILIDCPPTLNMLTVNALVAADAVLIPMQCEYYALEGLTDLIGSIQRVTTELNPALEIEGILRTMYDPRLSLTVDVSEQPNQHIGEKLVTHCMSKAKELGFKILQFNAVVKSNEQALRLYEKLGFIKLGIIPHRFLMKDGTDEDIIPHYHVL